MFNKIISQYGYTFPQGKIEIETYDETSRSNVSITMKFDVDNINVFSKMSDDINTTISFDAGNTHTIKILIPNEVIPLLINKLQERVK